MKRKRSQSGMCFINQTLLLSSFVVTHAVASHLGHLCCMNDSCGIVGDCNLPPGPDCTDPNYPAECDIVDCCTEPNCGGVCFAAGAYAMHTANECYSMKAHVCHPNDIDLGHYCCPDDTCGTQGAFTCLPTSATSPCGTLSGLPGEVCPGVFCCDKPNGVDVMEECSVNCDYGGFPAGECESMQDKEACDSIKNIPLQDPPIPRVPDLGYWCCPDDTCGTSVDGSEVCTTLVLTTMECRDRGEVPCPAVHCCEDQGCSQNCDIGKYTSGECASMPIEGSQTEFMIPCNAPGDPFHFDESLPVNNLGIAPAGDPVRPDDPPPVNNLDTATGDSVRPDDHDDKTGGMDGDPHVQLWNHTWFDYHGGCDLVLLNAPHFYQGLGLTIHVRTTVRYDYSFISSCSVKLGEDILEVSSWGDYSLNSIFHADMPNFMSEELFEVSYYQPSDKEHIFNIHLGEGEIITIKTFKDFVGVKIEHGNSKSFRGSVGLMGDFVTGQMLARDGKAVLQDPRSFGQEWQVRPDLQEPMLFETIRAPQYPEKCILPSTKAKEKRRQLLPEKVISREDAEKACAPFSNNNPGDLERCVFDVLASGDLELAQAGGI